MAFVKKTWKNRIAEYINRRLLTNEDGSTNLVTVARDEGTISQEGDAFNAANMNDLEDRIEAGFEEINQSLIDKSMNALFTVKEHGALATSGYYTLTSIIKNFGSNDIYVDKYGSIIFKKLGHYMLNISLVLDKNFTSTLADISVHRYDSKGGSDTLISEDYFFAANNVHTGNVNILIPITAYGYLKIYCFGKVQGGYISLHRVE